jgi:hypothetical protein
MIASTDTFRASGQTFDDHESTLLLFYPQIHYEIIVHPVREKRLTYRRQAINRLCLYQISVQPNEALSFVDSFTQLVRHCRGIVRVIERLN